MNSKKRLIILVGLKGSGKSHIGSVVEQNTPFHFLRVEPIWISCLQMQSSKTGWEHIITAIEQSFITCNTVMIESLGLGEPFSKIVEHFENRCRLRLVRISADPEVCFSRVKSRSTKEQIPVSDEKIHEYNQLALKVNYPWDLVIDNSQPLRVPDILTAFTLLITE